MAVCIGSRRLSSAPAASVAALSCSLLFSGALFAQRAQLPVAPERDTYTGTVEQIVIDDFAHGTARTVWYLRTANGRFEIDNAAEARLRTGSSVTVHATRSDSRLKIESQIAAQASAALQCSPVGEQKTVVLLVTMPSQPALATPFSVDNVRQALFGTVKPSAPNNESLNGVWKELSYGRTTVSGDVYGPFRLAKDYTCDGANADLMRDAIAAADATVDFSQYTRLVLMFPVVKNGCPGSANGWATMGCSTITSPSKGTLPMAPMWYPVFADLNFVDVGLIAHEMGHGLGLDHSMTEDFGSVPLSAPGTLGTVTEYGDHFSIMGSPSVLGTQLVGGHYTASQKAVLHWLDAGDGYQQITTSGTYKIVPYESATGTRALKIARGTLPESWLWVEYRQPLGDVEKNLSQMRDANVFKGALVRYAEPGYRTLASYLLNFNIGTAASYFLTSAMLPGQSWQDPYSSLTLKVDSADASGLTLTATYATPCAVLSGATPLYGPAGGTGTVTVTAPSDCSWTASSPAAWLKLTGATSGQGNGAVAYSVDASTAARASALAIQRQSVAIQQTATTAAVLSMSPSQWSGSGGAFTFHIFDALGVADLTNFSVGFNPMRGCFFRYDPRSKLVSLVDGGSFSLNTAGASATDNYCTVYADGSSATPSGSTLDLTLRIDFNASMAGTYSVMGYANSAANGASAWPVLGTWTVCTVAVAPASLAFPASASTANIDVTAPLGCAWDVANSASWITPSKSDASVSLQLAANTGATRTATVVIGGQNVAVQQSGVTLTGAGAATVFPHFAVAGGWTTDFTLVNTGSGDAQTRLTFRDNTGAAQPLLVTGGATVTSLGAIERTLPVNATVTLSSSSTPSGQYAEGWSELVNTGSVDGFAVFRLAGSQEAVVSRESRSSANYFVPFDHTNNYFSGIAFANRTASPVTLSMTIRDGVTGAVQTRGTIPLDAYGHGSFLLKDQIRSTANTSGVVEFSTPAPAQVAVLGLRFNANAAFTSIPPLVPSSADATLANGGVMPHFASGGGWKTTFTLVNTGTTQATARLSFYDNNGADLALPLSYPRAGTVGPPLASAIDCTIAPGAACVVESEAPNYLEGWARLTTTASVSGFAVFRLATSAGGQEAVVPQESRTPGAFVLSFDNTNSYFNGVALANPATQAASVAVTIRDTAGAIVTSDTISLGAQGHTSFLLKSRYPAIANAAGTIEFRSSATPSVAVLGLRFNPVSAFTSIPAIARQ